MNGKAMLYCPKIQAVCDEIRTDLGSS